MYDDMPKTGLKDIFEISCCIGGICEYYTDGGYIYLSKGDCIVFRHDTCSDCRISASKDCCTITLLIETKFCNTEITELIGTAVEGVDVYSEYKGDFLSIYSGEKCLVPFKLIENYLRHKQVKII